MPPAQQQTAGKAAPAAGETEQAPVVAKAPETPQPSDEGAATPPAPQQATVDKTDPPVAEAEQAPAVAKAPETPQPSDEGAATPPAPRQAAAGTGGAALPEDKPGKPAATVAQAPAKPVADEALPADGKDSEPPATAEKAPEETQPAASAPPATAAAPETPAPEGQQAASGQQPSSGGVSVDSVDYDDRGNLALAGKAAPGSVVEPTIAAPEAGSESLGQARADEKGEWRLRVDKPVAPGRYDLTVEARTPEGATQSRIRLPFERADPITDFPPGDVVVVQPGNSLWRIARRIYGQGVRYTVIYAANQAQIGNPDLIFPGQIFSVPQEERSG